MSGTSIIKNIDKTPNSRYFNAHYFCDYIELLTLINRDVLSSSDIYDVFSKDNKISHTGDKKNALNDDKWYSRIYDWFLLLETRQGKFGKSYPFIVNDDSIKLKNTITNDATIFYIFLLLSSTRKYINDKNILTTDFENISKKALTNYLPTFSKTFQFGKSNVNYNKYYGHITNKIDTLANDLKCEIRYQSHFFSSENSGDGGLDIVAWVPFEMDENKNNIQIYLGQCATGKDWLKKQDDTQKFPNKYICFNGYINYIMFIPYDGRNNDEKFNEEADMGDYLLFDRFRIIAMIKDYSFIKKLPSYTAVVEKILKYEKDIV